MQTQPRNLTESTQTSLGDCDGDTIPADYDGHLDYGIGGAFLTVAPGDPMCESAMEAPHHGSSIHVEDRVFGFGVAFTVGAEYDCDYLLDVSVKCFAWCTPTFPPGLDGAYVVFIHAPATKGTVTAI